MTHDDIEGVLDDQARAAPTAHDAADRTRDRMDQLLINRIVEAALLASSQPLSLAQLRDLFPDDQPAPPGSVEAAIGQLQADCATRGVELVEVASGFRYQVQADVHDWIARLWTERQTRYTRATLETLALIAYRQPITRGEIEQVRGVTVSSNIIKALEEREWIRVVGHRDVPGRPALFGTTRTFLDYFGLKRLDELPPLSELKDIGELEPQLQFDDASGVAPAIAAAALGADAPSIESPTDGVLAGTDAPASEAERTGRDDTMDHAGGATVSAGNDDATDDAAVDASDGGTDGEAGDLDFRRERPVVFDDHAFDEQALDDHDRDGPSPDGEGDEGGNTRETHDAAHGDVDPEAAPGMRAATENDPGQDNAVATTTVPDMTTASSDAAESNQDE